MTRRSFLCTVAGTTLATIYPLVDSDGPPKLVAEKPEFAAFVAWMERSIAKGMGIPDYLMIEMRERIATGVCRCTRDHFRS